MARLSDIPRIKRSIGLRVFAMRVLDEMAKDNLLVWASALAYSWLFAIFPFLIFLLAIIPYLPQRVQVVSRDQVCDVMADQLPQAVGTMLVKEVSQNDQNILHRQSLRGPALCVALLLALWAASGGTLMTMSALDRCYELEKGRSIYRQRIVAVILTVFVALMLLTVMGLLPFASAVERWVVRKGLSPGIWELVLFNIARWLVSLVLMVLVLTVVYYKGPAIRHHFSLITPGAVFVVIVWVVMGILFRLYVDLIGARGFSQTYGTVGGVALLLLFFYLGALVLLMGGEINSEVDFEVLGVRRGTSDFRKCEDLSAGAPTSC